MLNFIKSLLTDQLGIAPTPTKAFVDEDGNLFSPTGEFVSSYSRRRDAIRAAKRRGFDVEA